jgi:hypothetical protein
MPQPFESQEQAVAWVTRCLASHSTGLAPGEAVAWLSEGRANRRLLPWERERVVYEVRPQCFVERVFARPALRRRVANLIDASDEGTWVIFSFNGQALSRRVGISSRLFRPLEDCGLWTTDSSLVSFDACRSDSCATPSASLSGATASPLAIGRSPA